MTKATTISQQPKTLSEDPWTYYPITFQLNGDNGKAVANHLSKKFQKEILILFGNMLEEINNKFPESLE